MTALRSFILLLSGLVVLLMISPSIAAAATDVQIGVLAKRGKQQTHARWDAMADYLTAKLPAYRFTIAPLSFDEIHSAVEKKQVAFVLANSAFYVDLEVRYGVSRLATLKNRRGKDAFTVFAGTIFTRADREDIRTLDDLRGKSFSAVDERSFGGFHMAWRELKERGIDPYQDFSTLGMVGTHDSVVYSVATRQSDAGTVRSDTLERMAQEGKIDLADFRVLNAQTDTGFPFLHSTRLYPEWPFARVAGVSDALAQQVAIALLEIPEESEVARITQSRGWTIPHEYQPVHDCLKVLQIAPYRNYGQVTIWEALQRLWPWFLFGAFLLSIGYFTAIHTLRINRRLGESQTALKEAHRDLEKKVALRTSDLELANELLNKEVYERKQAEVTLRQALKDTEEARNRVDNIVKSVINGLLVLDNAGKVISINEVAQEMFNVSSEQALGAPVQDLFMPHGLAQEFLDFQESVEDRSSSWEFELAKRPADGNRILQAWASAMRSQKNEVTGTVIVLLDMTKERELARLKDSFISTAAHELHTPLTSIVGYSELLLNAEGNDSLIAENRKDFLQEIVDKGLFLSRIVDDLLDISRIESGQPMLLALKPTDLKQLVEKIVNQYRQLSTKHDFQLTIDSALEQPLLIDSGKVVQVLENLLSNAVKYSPGGGPVKVDLVSERNAYVVVVEDQGVGMSQEQVGKVFDKFYRADNVDPAVRGLGLGMNIAKQIVEEHGGRIWVESRKGEGTRVSFALPWSADKV